MKVLIGNMFESKVQTLVNTVNCVGVMGKGVALEFKQKYPRMFQEYVDLCKKGLLHPGQPYYYSDLTGTSVVNFPTKDHWRSPSKLSYIVSGLEWFRNNYKQLGISSIAFPPLGCGNGGLSWEVVGPLMYEMLSDLPIQIEVYAPYGTPVEQLSVDFLAQKTQRQATTNLQGKTQQKINDKWLLVLEVVRQVNAGKHTLHVGRVIFQKICYVLTRTGIQTGFSFVKGYYGPYSTDVKMAINALSNANLIIEHQSGQKMLETHVTPKFVLPKEMYSVEELNTVDATVDLFSRIKNTDQAEMMATVMYAYDQLLKKSPVVEEKDIFDYVLTWKRKWEATKEQEITECIRDLAMLRWIRPIPSSAALNEGF